MACQRYSGGNGEMKTAKRESLKIAERLGHRLTSFAPYGNKEYSYCENPSCKARLIIQGNKAAAYALSNVEGFDVWAGSAPIPVHVK